MAHADAGVQDVQTCDVGAGVTLLYVPATHAVHTREEDAEIRLPYKPAEHSVQLEVPVHSALYLPATHAVQTDDVIPASTSLYVPVGQSEHSPPIPATLL